MGAATPTSVAAVDAGWVQNLLDQLDPAGLWARPLVAAREAELTAAHRRLRKLTREGGFTVRPHEPPDVLAVLALIPAAGDPR